MSRKQVDDFLIYTAEQISRMEKITGKSVVVKFFAPLKPVEPVPVTIVNPTMPLLDNIKQKEAT